VCILFASPSELGSTQHKFTRRSRVPPAPNTDSWRARWGQLCANVVFPPFFRMANPEHPFPLATMIWFGSLEFMSLGYGYDMVLLPPRHPADRDHELSQPGEASRPYCRSRRAHAARRCRARHCHRCRLSEGEGVPRPSAPQPDADVVFLGEDLCRMALAAGGMPTRHPDVPPSGAAPPPP
jgi:hypothetical protein